MLLTYLLVYAVQFFFVGSLMAGGARKLDASFGIPFSGIGADGIVLAAFTAAAPIVGPIGALLGVATSGYVGFTTKWTADK